MSVKERITAFFNAYPEHRHLKGAILTLAEDQPKGISLLVEGIVEQYDISSDGQKIVVNIFKPPAFYPMSWAMNATQNRYFFGALTDVTIRVAPAKDVIDFLQANPDVVYDLLSRVYRGTDALLRRLFLALSGVASSRLAYELLIECYRFGTEVGDSMVHIAIRQTELASRCGLTRETVSRELKKLETENIISRDKIGYVLDTKLLLSKTGLTG